MGQAIKQLLPWPTAGGEQPMVCASFDAIAPWCQSIVVVLGHEAERVRLALEPRAFATVMSDPDTEMFDSIRLGLRVAMDSAPQRPMLLQPGDHPLAPPRVMSSLIDVWRPSPDRVVMPEHSGKGGHPVIIPPPVARSLIAWTGAGGLRRFWIDHPHITRRVPVETPEVAIDLNTFEQYEAARIAYS